MSISLPLIYKKTFRTNIRKVFVLFMFKSIIEPMSHFHIWSFYHFLSQSLPKPDRQGM